MLHAIVQSTQHNEVPRPDVKCFFKNGVAGIQNDGRYRVGGGTPSANQGDRFNAIGMPLGVPAARHRADSAVIRPAGMSPCRSGGRLL